jgi:hypothetical protein
MMHLKCGWKRGDKKHLQTISMIGKEQNNNEQAGALRDPPAGTSI